MSLLTDLHAAAALGLLLVLLFAEEAGVPIPFAPGEVTLVGVGLLVASGALSVLVAIPLCWAACSLGAWVGFQWSRRVGIGSLTQLATHLHAEEPLRRTSKRLANAGPRTVALSRAIPPLRIYTSLVAGAVGVAERTFVVGALPAIGLWVSVWILLGTTVGYPAIHVFSDVERLLLRGVILLGVGVLAWVAARRIPPRSVAGSSCALVPQRGRLALAVVVDAGIVACIVAGVGALFRTVVEASTQFSWVELSVTALGIATLYVVVGRREIGGTAGETVLGVSYLHRRPRRAADAERSGSTTAT